MTVSTSLERWGRKSFRAARHATALEQLVSSLVEDLIEHLFSGFRLDGQTVSLFRRKTVGNMVFNDKCTCIGREPEWHRKMRRRKAE